MKKLTLGQIEKAVDGRLICGERGKEVLCVSTDSRIAKEGDVFFPLIGENLDAHAFISDVARSGCKCIVASDEGATAEVLEVYKDLNIIMVEDTTRALQNLAKWYLAMLDIKKIGVTGSTGKTTTKDMLYYICSEKYKTGRNTGNFNNHIGLPLTVLSFEEDTEAGILEMGMSEQGEIDVLADMVKPDIGIITNIGISHMENLGSRENILKAKMEITNYFDENNILIIYEGCDLLTKDAAVGNYRLVTIGHDGKSDYIISDICDLGEKGIKFSLEHQYKLQKFKLPVPGRHNAINASLAVAAGMELGISMEQAATGLEKMVMTEKRLNIRGKDGIKVIDDTYNASPDSMRAALDVLVAARGLRKLAVLGDMFELGEKSGEYHQAVGEYAAKLGIDMVIAIGDDARYIAEGALSRMNREQVLYYGNKEGFLKDIDKLVELGDVVLVKGSRGMKMDMIVRKILD